MSEFGNHYPAELAERVHASENVTEENLRDINLAEMLFHGHLYADTVEGNRTRMDELGRLQSDFLTDKRGLNMGERFALALSNKYLGKIRIVELGSTDKPHASGQADGLKDEYRDLLRWMTQHGIVENELSRTESGRTVSLRKPTDLEASHHIVIAQRVRALVEEAIIEHDHKKVKLSLAKRMVFGMPLQTARTLLARTGNTSSTIDDEHSLQYIEMMLQDGRGGFLPIRTAYYLDTEVSSP